MALEALAAAAFVAASRADLKEAEEDEVASAAALVVAVVASEAAATLAPEAVTETALEHPTERHQDLALVGETGAIAALVGMSLEVVDAHMMTDLAATETEVDMAIVIVVIVSETVVTATATAMDDGLAATWNPLAAEKVGIGTGTMTALATTTAGNEDTRVVATKTPESCAATSTRARLSTTWWVSYIA